MNTRVSAIKENLKAGSAYGGPAFSKASRSTAAMSLYKAGN